MINAGTVQVKLFADVKQFTTGMHGATAAVSSMSKSVVNMSKTVVFALGAITAASAKMATDFDKRLREISTLVIGVTENNIKEFSREIRDLANTTGKALDDIGKAKYDIISAGFVDLSAAAVMLNSATRLAVGGVTSVTKAADLLISSLNSWQESGYQAEKYADILFTTVRLGKTTMDELAGSVGRVFPTARTLGATLEDVGAALATVTAGGISTYEASTYLNQAFTKLGAPSISAKKAMELYGIEVKRFDNGMLDLLETIKQFQGYDLETMRKFFPEIRAIKAILSMANNLKFLERALNNTYDAAGASQEAFAKMEKSFSVQLQQSMMRVKDIMIDIGDNIMPTVVKYFNDFIFVLDNNSSAIKNMANIMLFAVDALGKIILNMPTVIAAFIAYKIAVNAAAIKTALLTGAMMTNPVTLWAIGIAAVVAVLADFIKNTISARNEFIKFADESKKYQVKDIPKGMQVNPQAYFVNNAPKFIPKEGVETGIQPTYLSPMAMPMFKGQLVRDIEMVNKTLLGANKKWLNIGESYKSIIDNKYTAPTRQLYELLTRTSAGFDNTWIDGIDIFGDSDKALKDATEGINKFIDTLDYDNIREKIGTGTIGDNLGLDNLRLQLDNAADAFSQLGIADVTKEMLEIQGINFSNLETAIERLGDAKIPLDELSKYDLSVFGIDAVELEEILGLLKYFGVGIESFTESGKVLNQQMQYMKDTLSDMINMMKNSDLKSGVGLTTFLEQQGEMDYLSGYTEEVESAIGKTKELGNELIGEFQTIGESISSTLANSFTEIILSGRVAMQELEKYNKGLTNDFRTAAEIREDAWANMWNNILADTVRALLEIAIKYTLLTAALIALDTISGGLLRGALGVSESVGGFWGGMADFFKASGGGGFAQIFGKKLSDGVITPQGQVIRTAPDDYIMAMKNPQKLGDTFGGGGTYNITINALDGADVERVLMRNPSALARGVGNVIEHRNLRLNVGNEFVRAKY